MNHHAIPPKIAQAEQKAKKEKVQLKLDETFFSRPEVFTRQTVLHAVAQFVACDDQVSVMLEIRGQYLLYTLLFFPGLCCCE